jgi:tRNA(Arg) A34 adenosine deaminase TadA
LTDVSNALGDEDGGPEADHARLMRACIEAVTGQVAASTYPLAAAVVLDGEILALQQSRLPARPDPSAHPEMEAVRAAAARMNSRYLPGAVLYSTLEPCPMCTSVAIWAKMAGIVFGASQDEALAFAERGATGSLTWRQIRIRATAVADAGTPHLWVTGGVLRDECLELFALTGGRGRPEEVARDR